MYQFNQTSAIAKVMKSQKHGFAVEFSRLKGQQRGIFKKQTKPGDEMIVKTYFVDESVKGCVEEIFDIYTRDMKNKKFFFFTERGEFVRFWREKDMFGENGGLGQHVYTVLPAGKTGDVFEIRAMVDEVNKKVVVSEGDKEEYKRLCLARKNAEEVLADFSKSDVTSI